MFTLSVFYGGKPLPHRVVRVERSADVLTLIPQLLAEHDGCEHIVVALDDARLFAVDCRGNRMP